MKSPARAAARPQRYPLMSRLFLGLLLAASASPVAFAHGGEDHAEAPHAAPAAVEAAAGPRAEAASDNVEALAVLQGTALTLYLDRFATNEPIVDAGVELEIDGRTLAMQPASDGSYRAELGSLSPGQHSLLLTIQSPDLIELLPLELTVPAPQAAAPVASAAGLPGLSIAAAGAGLLALAVIVTARGRRAGKRRDSHA